VPLRLGQEVQEVPRRLTRPDPPLADDAVRLEPLSQADHAEFVPLVGDEAIEAFTRIPSDADAPWVARWIERYENGWEDGSCAGFAIRPARGSTALGFAALVHLDLDAREGEIGYLVLPAARGRGTARRALRLLTGWGFAELGLERLELRIDVANLASERVAERCGYRRDGVLRNMHFKEGRRADTAVWSRLRAD
jgi:RimJ/RimL family protein N-acetyltransferase